MGSVLKQVLVVGAGAMGSWLAARLGTTGAEVHLLARPGQKEVLSTAGLMVETLPDADPAWAGSRHFDASVVTFHDTVADCPKAPDLLIVATRAYQTAEAARTLAAGQVVPRFVLTLQNGLGNAEALATAFGPERILAGTTSHGVTRLSPSAVRHAGGGDTKLGPWTPAAAPGAEAAAALLEAAGIETRYVSEPRSALWTKVAVNAAINPPTAIHRIENGALLDGGALERDLRAAAREVAAVATAEGVPLHPDEAEASALAVARRTARNRSSMLQAREAGRPLETEAITGEVVRRAVQHGLAVPVNRRHLDALLALAASPEGS